MKNRPKANLATARLQVSFFFFILLFCGFAGADDFGFVSLNNMAPPQIEISYPPEKTVQGTLVNIQISIPDGWHVNANIAADKFLKPSTLEIRARGIEFGEPIWPTPIKEYSEALDLENLVFKGTFLVQVPVKNIAADYDTSTTNIDFSYQACSQICLAPQTVHASMQIKTLGQSKDGTIQEEPLKKNSGESLILLLGFAFLGGLILNLMPCVLPVLFLKLFNLTKNARETRTRLWKLTGMLVFGILISFWSLAAVVALIQAGNGLSGWGFQFQNPGFIVFMVVLLSAFAMNLFGAFELFLPGSALTKMDAATRKEGLGGAFASGILMVLLSTPCSAPFLGTAMGFAFTQPTSILFLFFTLAALGLAFPYILVAIFPSVLKVFPKPGAWMVKVQKLLGLFLFGTAAWLVWISFRMAGTFGAVIVCGFGIFAIFAAIAFGKFARPDKPFVREPVSLLVIVFIFLAAWFLGGKPAIRSILDEKARDAAEKTLDENGWYLYSEEAFQMLSKESRPIFVDVTADWCLTCKTNEAMVLSKDDVKEVFSRAGAILVKADYTLESPEVTRLLRTLGKSGVPAYAVYHPESGRWEVLSEILTRESIAKALSEKG